MLKQAPSSENKEVSYSENNVRTFPNKKNESFKLRDYQKKVINDVYNFFRLGKKSCLVYAPTGAGKTVIAIKIIADAVAKGRKVLFCCHRTKLVTQTQESLLKFFNIQAGIIWADNPVDYSLPVQIGMIQTLQNRELPPDIGLVIFDECHSSSYYKISWEIMMKYSKGIFALSPCFFIGLTATPWRTKSKEGFCQIFDCLVKAPYPIELVKMGYLSRPRLFGYGGLIDFSQLETNGNGDYTEASMQKVCNSAYNSEVIKKFLEICPERKTIAFCSGIKQAQDLAQQFNQNGIISELIIGDTPQNIRDEIFERFKRGETQLISSVSVLCEGFDEPSVEAAIIARPTKSKALLIQMVGRALRLYEGKKDAYLLDFGECFQRICFPTKKLPITLCPTELKNNSTEKSGSGEMLKECPNCHALVHKITQICPVCGYEFKGNKRNLAEDDDPIFGELLTEEEKRELSYVRQQMKRKFTQGQDPARVKSLFLKKFGYFAPDEWFVGAIFAGKNRQANQQIYLTFLHQIRPKATEVWLKYMMELEFGKPGKEYKHASGRTYTAEPVDLRNKNWWEILGIPPLSPFEMVKSAYRELAKRWHPDICDEEQSTEMMKLINHAFDQAKLALGIN
jgi:superfamily II DNA or RNA helicase